MKTTLIAIALTALALTSTVSASDNNALQQYCRERSLFYIRHTPEDQFYKQKVAVEVATDAEKKFPREAKNDIEVAAWNQLTWALKTYETEPQLCRALWLGKFIFSAWYVCSKTGDNGFEFVPADTKEQAIQRFTSSHPEDCKITKVTR